MGKLSLEYKGQNLSLAERDFFDSIGRQIQTSEKDIPLRQRKKYKLEVSKKAQEYVLSLIDIKSNQEIKRMSMQAEKSLQELEARLLIELSQSMERQALQAAIDIQRDFKDAQELAKKIDPEDEEFHEEFLKDIRNSALSNLKDIARLKERSL